MIVVRDVYVDFVWMCDVVVVRDVYVDFVVYVVYYIGVSSETNMY